jgi:uncharacterized peroxidase-related enzyme
VQTDFRKADLEPQTHALLKFAEKVSLKPSTVADEDLNQLRQVGLNDEDIFLATHIIGIFNYLVRLADVFGLEVESEVQEES